MAYTIDAMISVLQKAKELQENHKITAQQMNPCISDLHLVGNEIGCYHIAKGRGYIREDIDCPPEQRGEVFFFSNDGKIELDYLLEKREMLYRERETHQAVILTLQKQEEALQKQTDALEVQIKTLEAQKQGNRLTVLTGILVALLGYVLGLLTPYLK